MPYNSQISLKLSDIFNHPPNLPKNPLNHPSKPQPFMVISVVKFESKINDSFSDGSEFALALECW
jgi:hypothetical protein